MPNHHPMQHALTVRIMPGYLRILQRVLQQQRLDFAQLNLSAADATNFATYLTDEQQQLCTVHEYVRWLKAMQLHLSRPVAIVLAEHMVLEDIGLVGYLLSTSLDLHHALGLFEQYYPLLHNMTNAVPMYVQHSHGLIRLSWQMYDLSWQLFDELNVCLLYRAALLISQSKKIIPRAVYLGHFDHSSEKQFVQYFHCAIASPGQQFGLSFDEQILTTKSIAADAMLNQVLSQQAAQSVQHFRESHTEAVFELKHKILALLSKQDLSDPALERAALQHVIAAQMHCSVRTLQRQLKRHDLDFQSIVDEYRYHVACQLLQQPHPLNQIAAQLGYADQSAFGRAFKRWSGQTPKRYRQQLRELQPNTMAPNEEAN